MRRYLDRPVEREKIELCLEAARFAPSACNAQPWKFVVIDDPAKKERLRRAAFSGIYSVNAFAGKAPVLIIVFRTSGKLLPRIAGCFQGKEYPIIDIGIAGEHLVLQATDLGLGTCWVGWFNGKGVRKALNSPLGQKPVAIIPVGYPVPDKKKAVPRKPLEKISDLNPLKL